MLFSPSAFAASLQFVTYVELVIEPSLTIVAVFTKYRYFPW